MEQDQVGGGEGEGDKGVRGGGVEKAELAQGLDMKLAAKRLKQDQVGGGGGGGGGWNRTRWVGGRGRGIRE